MLTPLTEALENRDPETRRSAHWSLKQLTRYNLGPYRSAWRKALAEGTDGTEDIEDIEDIAGPSLPAEAPQPPRRPTYWR